MSAGSAGDTGPRATILIVEPDKATAVRVTGVLVQEHYQTVSAETGRDAVALLAEVDPNLVLMEWALPDMAGLDLCRYIRAQGTIPVIVASESCSEGDAVASLEAGADGFLTKPYRWRELVARVGAALRRSPRSIRRRDGHVHVVGDITLDADRHEVWVGSREVELPLREFQVLEALLATAGKVWTREALMRRVWGETPASGTKSLAVHVARLRARIEDNPSSPTRILTVRGVGYSYAPGTAELAVL